MTNKKIFTLTYQGVSKTYQMNAKGLSDSMLYANRVDICKHGFAEEIVTKELLDNNVITEDNMYINELGDPTRVAEKTLSKDVFELYRSKMDDVYSKITISWHIPIVSLLCFFSVFWYFLKKALRLEESFLFLVWVHNYCTLWIWIKVEHFHKHNRTI